MRALTAADALRVAADRARVLESALRAALRGPAPVADLRIEYVAALGEAVIWTARLMAMSPDVCPLCSVVSP